MYKTFLLINQKTMDEVIVGRNGKEMTKAELSEEVRLMAKGLALLGLKHGQLIMLMMPLLTEGIIITMAANAIGLKVAYANYDGAEGEFVEELLRYKAKAVLRDYNGTLVFHTGKRSVSYADLRAEATSSKLDISKRMRRNTIGFGQRVYLQTSGSTAIRPKGLPFSNWNILAALIVAAMSTGTSTHSDEVEKALCILNFRHPYGWMPLFVNVMGGNRVELALGASREDIANWHQLKPSYIYGTPQFLREFIALTPPDADLSFLRAFFCAGDSTDEELFAEAKEFFRQHHATQAEVRNNYGAGELLCIGTTSDGIEHEAGASGRPYHGLGIKFIIVDEFLRPVETGEVGEIIIHSPTMIRRYYQNPEETRKSFFRYHLRRFYRTGDYAMFTEKGNVKIIGRIKQFYQPRGAIDKVNCGTIEHALRSLTEFIQDDGVAVIIYQLEDKSKSSCAFVVLKPGVPATEKTRAEIYMQLRSTLRAFQLPSRIEFIDAIPLNSAKKIDRIALGAELQRRMQS